MENTQNLQAQSQEQEFISQIGIMINNTVNKAIVDVVNKLHLTEVESLNDRIAALEKENKALRESHNATNKALLSFSDKITEKITEIDSVLKGINDNINKINTGSNQAQISTRDLVDSIELEMYRRNRTYNGGYRRPISPMLDNSVIFY